ncbi:MAG: class I SAM-dependent DNA methyltransferase, partial [Anaerolineae bacterium]|nr:class I SAM-dependent DNA methyltransferase [Anaerolineae bacterium]
MDTKPLETFAQSARRQLHEQVAARLNRVLTADSAELRAKAKTVEEVKAQVAASSRRAVVEKVAYTWFNRFCALRYMDVNHYTRAGTVSPAPGFTQPEILQEAKQGHVDERFARTVNARTVFGLLNGSLPSGDPQQEAYRLLLVGVCNAYHDVMPFMFEKIDDYTELLMPDDLLSESSILQGVREALTEENCRDVEVIGWLYQFYISEKKDAVMARKGAVPSEDIPAVTQLFTPHWIVRYMVENSLGRLWMLNHPESCLVERMDYYIAPEGEITEFLRVASPEEIRLCDPACGSGHILTYAFDLLYAIYEEQGYNPIDIPSLILQKNLTGIEIDPRAGALTGFALTMKAREKDRRFFQRDVRPEISVLEVVTFAPDELDAYLDRVGR